MQNKFYYAALNRIPQFGPRTLLKLLKKWPDLHHLFNLSPQQLNETGLPEKMIAAIRACDLSLAEADLLWEQASEEHHLLCWDDPNYPPLLKQIADPPPILYAQGNITTLQGMGVAIVGTRKPSFTGSETAQHFAFELARNNIVVVSGLASGIDAQAHQGCIAAKGLTIAVMGTGIDRIYPAHHRALRDKIQQNGLILTEFPLKSSANAGHFPRRNRIISGLSLITLVIEAAIKSGSLITARLAMEQNRDVMAIPGSIHNPQARGCHLLLQQGAKLVTTINDVLEELPLAKSPVISGDFTKLLASSDRKLVKCMGFETTTIDQLCQRTGLSIDKISCDLAELELQGIIQAVPGGYMRCM